MLVDLDNLFWMNDYDDDDSHQSLLVLGFSIIAEIRCTKEVIERNGCNHPDLLIPTRKYTSIFNGFGHTIEELQRIYESDFEDIPIPGLFPIIGQSDDLNQLKSDTVRYLELQFNASKPSRSDIKNKIEKEEQVLSSLVNRYMSMFTIKNELN